MELILTESNQLHYGKTSAFQISVGFMVACC